MEIDGASRPGTMVYNSWITMQAQREGDDETCQYNDLALVKIDPVDVAKVNPSVPYYGGPVGVASLGDTGDTVYTYGNSSLRAGVSTLSPKQGTIVDRSPGGWSYDVYTATPGIPGDSGSGFLNASGAAGGVLSTVAIAPLPASNGVGDLGLELAYMHSHGGPAANVVNGTEPFSPGSAEAGGASTPRLTCRACPSASQSSPATGSGPRSRRPPSRSSPGSATSPSRSTRSGAPRSTPTASRSPRTSCSPAAAATPCCSARWAGRSGTAPTRRRRGRSRDCWACARARPLRQPASGQGLPALAEASPLKDVEGVDMLVVRELTGGIYFGEKNRTKDTASDQCVYTREEIERITRVAFRAARSKVVSVDKANVLETSRLWREVVSEVHAAEFPNIELEHQLVDSCAMKLVSAPRHFEVILTENMFGDILSDEAAMLTGSLGMLPSASLGDDGGPGVYEPVHGSAPDIAGQGIANPLAMLLSAALMLRHQFAMQDEAAALESAVDRALEAGLRTPDLGGDATTAEAVRAVREHLQGA